jgi:hypothetical protein
MASFHTGYEPVFVPAPSSVSRVNLALLNHFLLNYYSVILFELLDISFSFTSQSFAIALFFLSVSLFFFFRFFTVSVSLFLHRTLPVSFSYLFTSQKLSFIRALSRPSFKVLPSYFPSFCSVSFAFSLFRSPFHFSFSLHFFSLQILFCTPSFHSLFLRFPSDSHFLSVVRFFSFALSSFILILTFRSIILIFSGNLRLISFTFSLIVSS